MVEITEKILKEYGIYKTRELKENEKEKLLEIKKEIDKVIQIPVERLYIINGSAWGKEPEKEQYTICVLVDKRLKDMEQPKELLAKYAIDKKLRILFWTLCQFEKRKNAPTEEEYYISRYGIKVYDSGKLPEINENVTTEYGIHMEYWRQFRSYIYSNPDYWMSELIRIYTLKIGYAVIGREANLTRDCNFAKLVSEDTNAIEIIDRYLNQKDDKEKSKIVIEFERYLKSIKQVKFQMKLEENPTMKVYEKLLKQKEKQGTLDIKTLTREELYIMYVIQGIYIDKIAELYGVENKKISSKNSNWKIIGKEGALINTDTVIKNTINTAMNQSEKYAYALLKKKGFMDFEKCAYPILEYMLDDNVYLLKEFWKFTEKEEGIIEQEISKNLKNSYYKASMCMELFKQNELVEEVEYKQYKITKKGKDLVWYCYRKDINEINIPIINKRFGTVNYYELYYEEEYPTEIEKVTWKNLYKKWTNYCSKNFPELQDETKLPIDNKVQDKEEIALIWLHIFFKSLQWRNIYPTNWAETIFIGINDIVNPIEEKIEEKQVSIIIKGDMEYSQFLDISNLAKYIKIEKLEDIVEFAATACAYMIKIRER